MAHSVGRLGSLEISDDGGSNYSTIGGLTNIAPSQSNEPIDSTDLDSGGWKEVEGDLSQLTLSGTLFLDAANAGQTKLLTAKKNKTKPTFRYREKVGSGLNQQVFVGYVTSFDYTNTVGALVECSFEVQSSGAVTESNQ
jgi:hypothetical protein